MSDKQISIRVDNRIRLMSAVLSITDLPERAQQRKGHRPHAHARRTTKYLEALKNHPAVQGAQQLLNQKAPLHALYSYAVKLSWDDMGLDKAPGWAPPNWNVHLRDFYIQGKIADLWQDDANAWTKATVEASDILNKSDYYEFLKPFVGDITEGLVYMPNISYPSDTSVGVRMGNEILCLAPPRISWGDNEPWPFDEDDAHIYSTSLSEYARLLMLGYLRQRSEQVAPIAAKGLPYLDDVFKQRNPSWGDQFLELFVPGCVAIYLENKVNSAEAKSFILMERKERGVDVLPGVVNVLQRYLSEYESGKYTTLIDFLPNFPLYLRVAKKISIL